jgi:mannose-6-phosphate isomerase-like protein (cupin superfamily)
VPFIELHDMQEGIPLRG